MDWYKSTVQDTAKQLKTNPEMGLTAADAQQRKQQYGPNQLVDRGTKNPWRIFLNQFKEIMVIILIIAAIVSALLGEHIDTIVILAIVGVPILMAF